MGLLQVESLVGLTQEMNLAKQDRADMEAKFQKELAAQDRVIARLVERFEMCRRELNQPMIEMAEKVVEVHGVYKPGVGDTDSVIAAAIDDIAEWNGKHLKFKFFGVKDYAQWSCQRCDCEYGYGPGHGYIVFKVGLRSDVRDRDLTDDEMEAAVYYLANLKEIREAKASA